jgi:hypothetical protein
MEQSKTGGLVDIKDRDELLDDPKRIEQYRAVGLAEGLTIGSEEEVLWAWQWLSDHPQFTSQLGGWFAFRVAELREMGRIK